MTELLGRRLVEELQRYWADHAAFPDLQVQGKHGLRERPQRGIVVKIGGANPVITSADHYRGLVHSRVRLTYFAGKRGAFVEWVREDPSAIRPGQPFPSPPGIYWLCLAYDLHHKQLVVLVDAFLDVRKETLKPKGPLDLLASRPFVPRSMRIRVQPYDYVLEESEFTTDPARGVVTLKKPLTRKESAVADYRYDAGERGPFPVSGNTPLTTAVPGVVVAIGRNLREGDVVGVVVEPFRRPTAMEYGGQWELSADIDVFARDVHDQREIADKTASYLWGVARSRLSSEGIEISQVSIGADSEESYDDNADEPYFTTTLNLACTTEWSEHYPLDMPVRDIQVLATTGEVPPGPPPGTDTERFG